MVDEKARRLAQALGGAVAGPIDLLEPRAIAQVEARHGIQRQRGTGGERTCRYRAQSPA